MGGDCVGIAWGRKNNIHFVWGWRGASHTRSCRVGSSPHTIPTQGFPSGDCVGWMQLVHHCVKYHNFEKCTETYNKHISKIGVKITSSSNIPRQLCTLLCVSFYGCGGDAYCNHQNIPHHLNTAFIRIVLFTA